MHSLGVKHTHTRPDRDQHIRVNWDNIRPDCQWLFKKRSFMGEEGLPYDLASVMHYESYDCSKNDQPTIEALDPALEHLLSYKGLREGDINLLKKIYNCWKNPWSKLVSSQKKSRSKPTWLFCFMWIQIKWNRFFLRSLYNVLSLVWNSGPSQFSSCNVRLLLCCICVPSTWNIFKASYWPAPTWQGSREVDK